MTPQFRSTYQQQHPHQKCDDTTVQINLPTTTSSPLLQSKLLTTMLPTPEERHKIQEATIYNPYLPLGSAEQCLMMLSSISELPARLKLWIFKLDYENMEKVTLPRWNMASSLKKKKFRCVEEHFVVIIFIKNSQTSQQTVSESNCWSPQLCCD
nr:FH1/FH2 domain-containing protein 1-like [Cherax quadricarinatus]